MPTKTKSSEPVAMDDPILTYGDTTLYQADIDLLEPGYWLNDNIIGFYFE